MAGIPDFEKLIFDYLDRVKELLSPRTWENLLLDCSKNEVFVMLLLYRKGEVNMTQVSDYLQAPLNTVTGIIDRMEKRRLLERQRSAEDKRVVTIRMTEQGITCIKDILEQAFRYGQSILGRLTPQELQTGIRLIDKVLEGLKEEYGIQSRKESSGKDPCGKERQGKGQSGEGPYGEGRQGKEPSGEGPYGKGRQGKEPLGRGSYGKAEQGKDRPASSKKVRKIQIE